MSASIGASALALAALAGCSLVYDDLGSYSGGVDAALDGVAADTSVLEGSAGTDSSATTNTGLQGDTGVSDAPPDSPKGCKTVGPVTARAVAVDGAGVTWTSTGSLAAEDNVAAIAQPLVPGNDESRTLILTEFDLAIPAGATIAGVEVRIRAKGEATNPVDVRDAYLQLAPNGLFGGDDKGNVQKYTGAYVTRTYGGPADLWGLALTPAAFSSSFGIGFRAKFDGAGTGQANIDAIRLLVTYCE